PSSQARPACLSPAITVGYAFGKCHSFLTPFACRFHPPDGRGPAITVARPRGPLRDASARPRLTRAAVLRRRAWRTLAGEATAHRARKAWMSPYPIRVRRRPRRRRAPREP